MHRRRQKFYKVIVFASEVVSMELLQHYPDRDASPRVSVIIVNTNELHHLRKCLPAVTRQSYPDYEVIVVDNASTDGSLEFIEREFPAVRIVRSSTNIGYTGANNLGFQASNAAYLAVLNPDTEVDEDWLGELVGALEARPDVGLATSKILLMDQPDVINACGNVISVAGLTFCRGIGRPANEFSRVEEVPAVSGAAFLIRRSTLQEIGPFDADFFIYLEETDLSLRALLAGYKCLYVPTSKLYHKYIFKFSERKCFDIEKNRYYMLAKSFRFRTLLLISPILLFAELLIWGFMLTKGPRYVWQKLRSYAWLWHNRSKIRAAHAATQKIRRISDRALFLQLAPRLQFEQTAPGLQAQLLHLATTPVLSGLAKVSTKLI
jgi:GT2 family glycosyltransferase